MNRWIFSFALVALCIVGHGKTAIAQTPAAMESAQRLFQNADKDKDGRLTREELPEPLRSRFQQVDTNHDGFIDAEEDRAFRRRTQGRARTASVPEGMTEHRDLEYAAVGDRQLLLDVYTPDESDTPLPLIVWVHGGAWRAGDKSQCPALRFGARGYVVASVSYRLSQEALFPAQIEDCKAAIRWLRANAEVYGIDAERIGVWGSSAGGHLVALLGTSGEVPGLELQHGNREHSSRVQAVCDFFGPTDFLRMHEDSLPNSPIAHNAKDSPESQLIGGPIQEIPEKVSAANPITYVSEDDPPFLIVHGDKDPLVPWQQSKYLFEALQAAKIDHVKMQLVKGAGHGFGNNREVEQLVESFFDKHLKGSE